MQIILAVVLVVFILVLLKVRQKGQGNTVDKKAASKSVPQKTSSAKKSKIAPQSKKATLTAAASEQNAAAQAETVGSEVKEAEAEITSMNLNQPVKVSVQEVNPLTEYKVYREFGYLDKAAEALQAYLKNNPEQDTTLYFELAEIYLQAEQNDKLVDFVLDNKGYFNGYLHYMVEISSSSKSSSPPYNSTKVGI